MGQDLLQFTNAGVPLIAALAETMKKPQTEIKNLVSQGKVGFKEVQVALQSLGGEGGRFGGLMEAQSQSFLGVVSNISDSFVQIALDIGNVLLPAVKAIGEWVRDTSERFKEFLPRIKDLIIPVTIFVGLLTSLLAVGSAIVVLGPTLGAAFTVMTGPIGIITVAISGLVAALIYFRNSNSEIAMNVRAVWQTLSDIISLYAQAISQTLKFQFGAARETYKELVDTIASSKDGFAKNLEAERAAITKVQAAKDEATAKDIERKEKELEAEQGFFEKKAEIEAIAEEARQEFEETKKEYDRLSAEERIALLEETLGRERIANDAARMNELVSEGKHEKARALQDKLYKDAFVKLNFDLTQTKEDELIS